MSINTKSKFRKTNRNLKEIRCYKNIRSKSTFKGLSPRQYRKQT
ncbi:IS3 family transposase, partial [Staphylococcus saprophyticus]